MREGYVPVKLKFKVGFGRDKDIANFDEIRAAVGAEAIVMIDANQAWTPETAAKHIAELQGHSPYWVEEPLPAHEDHDNWAALSRACDAPLAAGENLRGELALEQA